jgi:hypothetical protein
MDVSKSVLSMLVVHVLHLFSLHNCNAKLAGLEPSPDCLVDGCYAI